MNNGNTLYAFIVFVALLVCVYIFITGSGPLWYVLTGSVTLLILLLDSKKQKKSK